MRYLALFLAILAITVPVLAATPLDDLKVAHGAVSNAVQTGNLSLLEATIHPNALGFFRQSQFPVQLSSNYGVRDAVPAVLADLSNYVSNTYESVFNVVGETGIVCTVNTQRPKSKKSTQSLYTRTTLIYTRLQGTWRLVSWHTSDVPLAQ